MTPVELPKANENLTEATLSHWIVEEGQNVSEKQSLCVIITDKATFEMPSPVEGTVRRIYQREKSLLPVGFILCAVGREDEAVPEAYEERNRKTLSAHREATVSAPPPAVSGGSTAPSVMPTGAVRATPAARRVAKEAGVDLADVARTMDVRRPVNEKDIRAFIEQHGKRDE